MIRLDLIESLHTEHKQTEIMQRSLALLEDLRGSMNLDPQMKDWIPVGANYDATLPPQLQSINLINLRRESKLAYHTNPHGRNIIRTLIKFVIGTGSMIDFAEKDEGKLKKITDFWDSVKKEVKWVRFQREYVRRLFRDGEVILRRFIPKPETEMLQVRYVEPDTLKDEDITKDPKDGSTVLSYTIGEDTVPAERVHFLKADVDQNVTRGRPLLEPILPYLTKYSRWLDARMVLNIVRASVTIVQEVAGSPSNLLNIAGKNLSSKQNASGQNTKMLRPGTILRGTPGVKYNMLSPNLDARDAAQDGRTILLAIAASAGFPDTFVTADYANSNFASTIAAQNPAIREFEDWQQLVAEGLSEIIQWFLDFGVEKGLIDAEADLNFSFGFPPLLKRDVAQENSAYQIMNQNGVCSRHTWAMKMGLDFDDEQAFIQDEAPIVVQTQPGNTNQPGDAKPPTQPQDRQPRQKIGAQRMQKQTQRMSFVVTTDKRQSDGRQVKEVDVTFAPTPVDTPVDTQESAA